MAVIDLTPGDGRLGVMCTKKKIPYLCIAFTTHHQAGLERRIKEGIFNSFCDSQCDDYDPTLATLLTDVPKEEAKPKAKAKASAEIKAKAVAAKAEGRASLLKRLGALQTQLGKGDKKNEGEEEETDEDESDKD